MNNIKVFAPATVSNVACGFDIMGFPLEGVGDTLHLTKKETPGLEIIAIHGANNLPLEADKNVATIALQSMLDSLSFQPDFGLTLEIFKTVKAGSGLGSSGSSSAAAVFALNELLGQPYTKNELIPFAMAGEAAISGQGHADNVAPCLLGGFVLVRDYQPLDVIQLDYPEDLFVSVVHPQIEIKTADARDILPKTVSLREATIQWGNVGGLVSGLAKGDYELIGRSLKDVIAEPHRAKLIPHYEEAKQAAMDQGALGCSISGSGPSIFALCSTNSIAEQISKTFSAIYAEHNIEALVYTSKINADGTKVVS